MGRRKRKTHRSREVDINGDEETGRAPLLSPPVSSSSRSDDNLSVNVLDDDSICADRYKSSLVIVLVTNMVDMLGFGLLLPILPYYYETLKGYTEAHQGLWYGLITCSFSAGQFLGSFLFGVLSDRVGRRPALMAGLLGTAFWYLMVTFADSILLLVVYRALGGLCAGTGGICSSYVADVTTKAERPVWLGKLGAAIGVGLVGGPALGGAISAAAGTHKGFHVAAYTSAGICLVNLAFAVWRFEESPVFVVRRDAKKRRADGPYAQALIHDGDDDGHDTCDLEAGGMVEVGDKKVGKESLLRVLMQRDLLLLCLATFFYGTVFVSLETSLPLLMKKKFSFPPKLVGAVFACYGAILIITQAVLFNVSIKKFGLRYVIIVYPIVSAVAMSFIPVGEREGETLTAVALMGVSQGFVYPSLSVLASLLSKEHHGAVMGMRQSFAAGCRTAGPLIAGTLFDSRSPVLSRYHHTLPFWLTGTCAAIVAWVFLLFMRTGRDQ